MHITLVHYIGLEGDMAFNPCQLNVGFGYEGRNFILLNNNSFTYVHILHFVVQVMMNQPFSPNGLPSLIYVHIFYFVLILLSVIHNVRWSIRRTFLEDI
jgi:hypothetical protein